jgi:hypothetical protein
VFSKRESRDVADRQVVCCKAKVGGALPKRLAVEIPVNDLLVKALPVRYVQHAGKRGVVAHHHLNRSDD